MFKYNSPKIVLILLFLIPLQNIYLGRIPSLGSGFNLLNILFLLAFIYSIRQPQVDNGNTTNQFVGIMAFAYIFSFIWGGFRGGFDEQGLIILKDVLLPYLLYFIVYRVCDSIAVMKQIFFATVLPLPYMFKVFYTNLSWMGFSSYKEKLRSNSGTFIQLGSNEIAAFYATYTFIILALAFRETNKYIRCGLYTVAGMNIYSLVYSFSRAAYLSSLVAITVLCALSGKLKQFTLVIILLLFLSIVGVNVLPTATFERFDSAFVAEEELDESVQQRLILWDLAIEKFVSNPIIGIGYRNFIKENPYDMDSHNFYVKTLAEGGLIGFVILITFFIKSLRRGVELYKTAIDPFLKALATGFIPCMIAMIIGNYFGDRFSHYPLISYFFVYLAMVVRGIEWSKEISHDAANTCPALNK